MKAKIMTCFVVCTMMGVAACSDDAITPSEDNRLVQFPQGNNSYDDEIMQIYEKYGTQILYRYNDAMFRWNVTNKINYFSRPADEQYAGDAVRFIKNNCFRFYREDSLKAYLPYRLYLAGNLGKLFEYSGLDAAGNTVNTKDTIWNIAATNGYANICFGLTSKRLTTMGDDSLRLAKGELNAALLANAISQGNIQVPAAFVKEEVTNVNWYNYVGSYNTYGLLEYIEAKTMKPEQDFAVFLKYLIAYPTEMFEQKFTTKAFDTSGRIARKAKVAKNWMLAEYGIDLENMATTPIER